MTHILRDRVEALVAKDKLTVQQVKDTHPVVGWERRYGRPEWTPEMFIDAVYGEFESGSAR